MSVPLFLQRGSSPEEVATKLLQQPGLQGLAGPTISPVFTMVDGKAEAQPSYFACDICVEKKKLYSSVKEIRQVADVQHIICCTAIISQNRQPLFMFVLF